MSEKGRRRHHASLGACQTWRQSCTRPGTRGKRSQMTDPRACVKRSEAEEGVELRRVPTQRNTQQVVWQRATKTHTHSHTEANVCERSALTRRLPWWRRNPVRWRIRVVGGVIFPQLSSREKVTSGPQRPPKSCACLPSLTKVSSRVNLPLYRCLASNNVTYKQTVCENY